MNITDKIETHSEESVLLDKKRVFEAMKTIKGTGYKGKYTTKDLAESLGYSYYSGVSKYLNGTRIKADLLTPFLKETGYRLQYLTGEDDFKTDEELKKYESEQNEQSYQNALLKYKSTLEYLKSLDVSIELNPYLVCNIEQLRCSFRFWKDRLYNVSVIESMLKSRNNDEDSKRLFRLKNNITVLSTIEKDLIEYTFVDEVESHLQDLTTENISDLPSDPDKTKDMVLYYYEVRIGNKVINHVPANKMSVFLETMDKISKTTARSLLSSNVFGADLSEI